MQHLSLCRHLYTVFAALDDRSVIRVVPGMALTKQDGGIVGGSHRLVRAAGEHAGPRRVRATIRRRRNRRSII
jgi:hypothetical protein